MIKHSSGFIALLLVMLSSYGYSANATELPENIPVGQTYIAGGESEISGYFTLNGTLENHGRLNFNQGGYIDQRGGKFINSSVFDSYGEYATFNAAKIVNGIDGTIIIHEYLEMNTPTDLFENFGRVLFQPDRYYGQLIFRGSIVNHGYFFLGGSDCYIRVTDPNSAIQNEGLFEIGSGTSCSAPKLRYRQTGGETKVNGVLDGEITIDAGKLSGIGSIKGLIEYQLVPAVTLAPGSPLGTLSLTPISGQLICTGCLAEIEIAEATRHDQLHIDGEFYMAGWKLKVVLRDGFIPPTGSTFEVLTADNIVFYGSAPKYTLPQLPNGRTWSVENTGTSIILHAN